MTTFDDPNREAVGLEPIWTGADDETPPPEVTATGATAGTPGSFTPAGATVPADLAGMGAITATPATAWATGEYVQTADAADCHWDGATWVAGTAAAARARKAKA